MAPPVNSDNGASTDDDETTAGTSRSRIVVQRAVSQLQPFQAAKESWAHYEQRLAIFFEINGVTSDRQKVLHSLTAVGGDVYAKVANLFAPIMPCDKPFDEVRAKIKTHFSGKRVVLYERRAFYTRSQKEGESLAEFDNALRALANTCDFGNTLDEMLRDRFVLGLRSQEAFTKIATEPTDERNPLTYQRAIDIGLELEVTNPIRQCSTIAQIGRRLFTRQGQSGRGGKHCISCGNTDHSRADCKLKDATCHFCKKTGHIQAACLQRQVSSGQQQRPRNSHKSRRRQPGANNAIDSNSDDDVVAVDDSRQGNNTVAWITPTVNGRHATRFMVDTGASGTVVVQETWGSPKLSNVTRQPTSISYLHNC